MLKRLAVFAVFAFIAGSFLAPIQAQQRAPQNESIRQEDLRADLFFLAGDSLRGRTKPVQTIARMVRHPQRESEDGEHGTAADEQRPPPQRLQSLRHHFIRDTDTERPRAAVKTDGTDESLDTVNVATPDGGGFDRDRGRDLGIDRLSEISRSVDAAGDDAALLID